MLHVNCDYMQQIRPTWLQGVRSVWYTSDTSESPHTCTTKVAAFNRGGAAGTASPPVNMPVPCPPGCGTTLVCGPNGPGPLQCGVGRSSMLRWASHGSAQALMMVTARNQPIYKFTDSGPLTQLNAGKLQHNANTA